MNETRARIRENISAARMGRDVKHLADLGPRYAGSEREWTAARYVEEQFRRIGKLEIAVDQVPGIKAWQHIDTRVRVIEPVEQELTASAILGSGSTPPEGVIGELLYVGLGRMEDYEHVDVNAKRPRRRSLRARTQIHL